MIVGQEPNPQRGAVAVTVGGRKAVLVANLGRMAALEDALGLGMAECAAAFNMPQTAHIIAALDVLSGGVLDREFLSGLMVSDIIDSIEPLRRCLVMSFTGGEPPEEPDTAEAGDPENPPTA